VERTIEGRLGVKDMKEEAKCPACGEGSYRLSRSDWPIGERRCCNKCGNRFFFQGKGDKIVAEILSPVTSPIMAAFEHVARTPPGAFDREIVIRQGTQHNDG